MQQELKRVIQTNTGTDDHDGLCLLSLDGGGVRGLSSLYILKGLMRAVNAKRRQMGEEEVLPWQLFDLIGGTSTGGLIAILLGRLRLNVDECISAYQRLCGQIFVKESYPLSFVGKLKGRFSTPNLERFLKEVVGEHINGRSAEHELFNSENDAESQLCKVFVCATKHEDIDKVARIRSYISTRQAIPDNATIWEAARATSAAPTFFEPITIGGQTYGDGGLLANNPVHEVWDEARDIWYPKRDDISTHIKCILSIGTGDPGIHHIEKTVWGFAKETLKNMATETRKSAEAFRQAHSEIFDDGRAFRFNVEQGLQDVGLEEHLKQGQILAVTGSYMESQDHVDRVERCAATLATKKFSVLHNLKAESVERSRISSEPFLVPYPRNPGFVARPSLMGQIMHQLGDNPTNTKRRTALYGLGGSGKTQIAIEFAYLYTELYPRHGVFWVHASTIAHIYESFAKIGEVYQIDSDGVDPKLLYEKVITWLQDPMSQPWLMIVDNADDKDVIFSGELRFDVNLERCPSGTFLFTTKHKNIADQITRWATAIHVSQMKKAEAVSLIKSIVDTSVTEDIAESLAFEMEYLPLALAQAAAYIRLKSITMEHYLDMWRNGRINAQELLTSDLFEAPGRRVIDSEIPNSVAGTMSLTLNALSLNNKRAEKILLIMTFFEPNSVPTNLLLEDNESAVSKSFVDAVGELIALSVIVRIVPGGAYSMHRLVHLVTARWLITKLSDQDLLAAAAQALARLNAVFPEAPEKADRHKLDAYIPHALNYLYIDKLAHQTPSLLKLSLVRKVAEHLLYQGRAGQAMRLRQEALELASKLGDPLSPVYLRAKYEAAVMAKYFHQFDHAKRLCGEIVDVLEEAKIVNRTLINSLVLLATLLAEERSWESAYGKIKRARRISVSYVAKDSKEIIALNFQEAETLRQQAQHQSSMKTVLLNNAKDMLKGALKTLGSLPGDHTSTILVGKQHLANIFEDLGDWEESETLRLEIVALKRETLGDDHAETFKVTRNLALCYLKMDRLKDSGAVLQKLLDLKTSAVDNKHPEHVLTLQALSQVKDKVVELCREKLQRLQDVVDRSRLERHNLNLHTLVVDLDLSPELFLQRRSFERLEVLDRELSSLQREEVSLSGRAIELRRKIITDMKVAFGTAHPETLQYMSYAANMFLQDYRYGSRCNYSGSAFPDILISEAIGLQREVLQHRKTLLGFFHEDTVSAEEVLAAILVEANRLGEAERLERSVYEFKKKKYGNTDRVTLSAMQSLAETCFLQDTSSKGLNMLHECFLLSQQHLGSDDKDTLTRHRLLETWRVKASLTVSESSSRKSARFMEDYWAGQGHDVTYSTAQFTGPTRNRDVGIAFSLKYDEWEYG